MASIWFLEKSADSYCVGSVALKFNYEVIERLLILHEVKYRRLQAI